MAENSSAGHLADTVAGRDLTTLVDSAPWHAEDLQVGDYMALGHVELGRAELLEFAKRYDPLPIHTDAATSPFGDVIASGIHTVALFSSVASRVFIPRLALVAGKGIDRLRLPHPVRPDSVLTGWVRLERIELRENRADVVYQATLTDQLGHVVLSFTGITVVSRRDTGAAIAPC